MESIIEKFYESFKNLDAEGMAACYHQDIIFEDPAFGILHGDRAKNMWCMLCASQKGQDFIVTYSDISVTDNHGQAHWEAQYNFSKTGKRVHNKIDAQFEIKDGLIIKHSDEFDLKKWAKQALGIKGVLIGGTGFFRKKLQEQTNGMLNKFERNN